MLCSCFVDKDGKEMTTDQLKIRKETSLRNKFRLMGHFAG